MAKERKPGFVYIQSDLLKQEVAFSKKTGWVYCEDGVKYSPAELAVIYNAGGVPDLATHNVKKVIGGEVVEVEPTGNKGKPDEGTGSNNEPNNKDTDAQIQSPATTSPANRDGELDIF